MIFRHIPAGRFRMGQRGGNADEEPVTEVEVPEFWMGETPVTQAQYRVMAKACLVELNSIDGNRGTEPSYFNDQEDSPKNPAEKVNWYEAQMIARWLMVQMSKSETLPPSYLVDLPPEALWEYACRAGTETEYWSGDGYVALAAVGWYASTAGGQTQPSGERRQPNLWGLHDMHGNVNEWCLDLHETVRARFRLPGDRATAYEDKSRLVRAPANSDHVAWAALFTRIAGGQLKLSGEDFPVMVKLRDRAKSIVSNGDGDWEPVKKGSEVALNEGVWPEDQRGIAEEVRELIQGWVDSASASSEPARVLRGGSWSASEVFCRSAYRYWDKIDSRDRNCGFRLCVFPSLLKQGLVQKRSWI